MSNSKDSPWVGLTLLVVIIAILTLIYIGGISSGKKIGYQKGFDAAIESSTYRTNLSNRIKASIEEEHLEQQASVRRVTYLQERLEKLEQ